MILLEDIGKQVSFNEEKHEYKNKAGKILTSVTTLISGYKTPFDETGIIARMCAKRAGITVQEILDKWRAENKRSCDYGHNLHSQLEHYLKLNEVKDTNEKDIIEQFKQIEFKGKIYSELRLFSEKYSIAGTCDVAELLPDNLVKIHDLKSNKAFTFKSKYNKNLFYPLEHLDESHINIYSLQILAYGEMVKEHGYNFEPGQILWINPATRLIERYDVKDLRKEVHILLNHFNDINNF